jgi:hypothetical protein
VRNAWLQTFSGRQFWPLDPSSEDVCIEDIAHALSLLCRFGGHVREFYSVGRSLPARQSYLVPEPHALYALLHDASEAYLVDMPRPIKHDEIFGKTYRAAEKRLMQAICERFALPDEEPAPVRRADNILLLTEQRDLMNPQVRPWSDVEIPLPYTIKPRPPQDVKRLFLERFYELDALRCNQADGFATDHLPEGSH